MVIAVSVSRGGGMGDILRVGDGRSDGVLWRHARLGECIVARIEVLAFLLHLHQDTLMSGELPILGEELLFLGVQFTEIDLVALER